MCTNLIKKMSVLPVFHGDIKVINDFFRDVVIF